MRNNKVKFGFTMAEMMVALAVMSVIATLLIPAIMQVKPDRSKILFKKAYYLSERIVSELINDEDAYPVEADKLGFDVTKKVTINGETYEDNDKFCKLFASKLNTVEAEPDCTPGAKPSFTTSDGISWTMPITSFATTSSGDSQIPGEAVITVDVNGYQDKGGKGPDCTYNANTCKDPDQFDIYVKTDGKMLLKDDKSKEYLKSNETMKK